MGNTKNGFDKKRDHNQYGEVDKNSEEKNKNRDLPKPPNKGTQPKHEK